MKIRNRIFCKRTKRTNEMPGQALYGECAANISKRIIDPVPSTEFHCIYFLYNPSFITIIGIINKDREKELNGIAACIIICSDIRDLFSRSLFVVSLTSFRFGRPRWDIKTSKRPHQIPLNIPRDQILILHLVRESREECNSFLSRASFMHNVVLYTMRSKWEQYALHVELS